MRGSSPSRSQVEFLELHQQVRDFDRDENYSRTIGSTGSLVKAAASSWV